MEVISLHIMKGSVKTVVDKETFEKSYKPNGWVIDKSFGEQVDEIKETVKELKSEQEVKNFLKMKKVVEKKFDDKLIKSE